MVLLYGERSYAMFRSMLYHLTFLSLYDLTFFLSASTNTLSQSNVNLSAVFLSVTTVIGSCKFLIAYCEDLFNILL